MVGNLWGILRKCMYTYSYTRTVFLLFYTLHCIISYCLRIDLCIQYTVNIHVNYTRKLHDYS